MSTVVIPSDRYAAIAGIIARLHNSGLSAESVMLIMAETIGGNGDAQFADLATWSTSQILSAAAKLGIKIIPARLERVMAAVRFITPTTPLCPCKKCALFTITNERGAWEVVLPGHACPFCNEYIEPNAVETKHVSWITGREVELSEEFDRSGAEPIPLTQQGIFDFVARRRKTIGEFIVTVVNRVLEGVPNPYLRLLNVLACHPKHSASFTRGPLQIISALYSPDAFGLIENEIKDLAFLAKQQWWVKGGVAASGSGLAKVLMPRGHVIDRGTFYRWLRKCSMDAAVQIKDLFDDVQVHERAMAREIMSEVMNRHSMGNAVDLFRTISSKLPHLFPREVMLEICIPLQRAEQIPGTSRALAQFNFNQSGTMDWASIAKYLAEKYNLPNVYERYAFSNETHFAPHAVVERLIERYTNEQIAQMINEACGFETER